MTDMSASRDGLPESGSGSKMSTPDSPLPSLSTADQPEKYSMAVKARKIGVFEYWPKERKILPDAAFSSMLGYGSDELSEDINKWIAIIPSDHFSVFIEQEKRLVSGETNRVELEHLIIRKGGEVRWLSLNAMLSSDTGAGDKIIGAAIDITDQKHAEEESRRFATVFEQVAESIMVVDTGGLIRIVNPAFEKMTGYSKSEVIGKNPRILSSGEHRKSFYRDMWRTITNGDIWRGGVINRHKDGSVIHAETTISPVLDSSGWIANYISVSRDVTRELALEKQLRQFHKMETVGLLAGGIAHDFNNILYAIRGYTELALQAAGKNNEIREMLDQVQIAERRGAELVGQVLEFSQQREQGRKPILVQQVLREVIKVIRDWLPSSIEINARIDNDCDPVVADPTQLFQVVMTICTNAYNAIRAHGGELEISLSETIQEQSTSDIGAGGRERTIRLRVHNSGGDAHKNSTDNIFDCNDGVEVSKEGSSFGLSVIQDIVESHGGTMLVKSAPGKGTTFDVAFPAYFLDKAATRTSPDDISCKGAGEKILVVDDEEALVKMLRMILEGFGYVVETWTDSQKALQAYRSAPDNFDLILTDQTMPMMTGTEMAKEILAIRPNANIILCTGFSEAISAEQALALGMKDFVTKPVTIRDLTLAISRVLKQT